MPEVSCKAVAIQNSSEWPCSMCPIPQLRLVGVRTSYIFFSNISWIPQALDPIKNPYLGPPLGCALLQGHGSVWVEEVWTLEMSLPSPLAAPCQPALPSTQAWKVPVAHLFSGPPLIVEGQTFVPHYRPERGLRM